MLASTRRVLLDALEALGAHRDAIVVIGAQAVFLHAGEVPIAVAPFTKDSDLGVDVRTLRDEPLVEIAMARAGFHRAPGAQPGSWLSPSGIAVDLMVPAALAGRGRRSVDARPHDKRALCRAEGLEASMVDNEFMMIHALSDDDGRVIAARVASPAALIVAKVHKIAERRRDAPERLVDKDAYDVYRLLVAVPTSELAAAFSRLSIDDLAGDATRRSLVYLSENFGSADGLGSVMAGRAEQLVGDPAVVAATCAALTTDLLSRAVRSS